MEPTSRSQLNPPPKKRPGCLLYLTIALLLTTIVLFVGWFFLQQKGEVILDTIREKTAQTLVLRMEGFSQVEKTRIVEEVRTFINRVTSMEHPPPQEMVETFREILSMAAEKKISREKAQELLIKIRTWNEKLPAIEIPVPTTAAVP